MSGTSGRSQSEKVIKSASAAGSIDSLGSTSRLSHFSTSTFSTCSTSFTSSTFELFDLVHRQLPPLSDLELVVCDRPEAYPPQCLHRMSDGFAHPPYLTIASFADRD